MKDDVFGSVPLNARQEFVVDAMRRLSVAAMNRESDPRIPIQPRPADLDPAAWARRFFSLSAGTVTFDRDIFRRNMEVTIASRDAIVDGILCGHLHEEVAVLIAAALSRGREEGQKEGIRLDAARRAALAKAVTGAQRFMERPRRIG
jgi:hypothetical protein